MGLPVARKTRDQARRFTAELKARALAEGFDLNDFILEMGLPNDTREGKGPRHAIVDYCQDRAREGASFGQVLGQWVKGGNGRPHRIKVNDLAGFVCANGFCKVREPGSRD